MSDKCCSSKHEQRRRGKLKIYDIYGFIWVPNFNGLGRFQDGYRLEIGYDHIVACYVSASGYYVWTQWSRRGDYDKQERGYKSFKAAMKAAVCWVVNSNKYREYI